MTTHRKFIEGERLWSIAAERNTRVPEKPIVLLARQVSDQRPIRIRLSPQELRWLYEHVPKVLMEYDICRVCTHPRSTHSGIQGEQKRGVCQGCDQYCTKFVLAS